MTPAASGKRYAYLDFLRILAAFLVIVNHTNSYVFKALSPENGTWWASVLWYYLSKTAVPLFVMISGACLLGKTDSYGKIARRFLRLALALALASYVYFLYDAWVFYGLWPRAIDFPAFFVKVWRNEFSDGFWYLYFYLGMTLTLPFWQRMARNMEKRDYHYLMAVTFGVSAAWPLVLHYMPQAAFPAYFNLPMLGGYVGLFFAGRYIHLYGGEKKAGAAFPALALAVGLGICLGLTRLEWSRVAPGSPYWFMDDRSAPALPVILCAMAMMALGKRLFPVSQAVKGRVLSELGGCAFGIYLIQDLLVAETKRRLFLPLCQQTNSLLAALGWEIAVFGAALAVTWIARRIPGLRRIL